MELRHIVSHTEYKRMTSAELRAAFLINNLFAAGEITLLHWETDRTIIGSIVPLTAPLQLQTAKELAATYFCERREVGVLNVGGAGTVTVDGISYDVAPLDCLYIGRGSKDIHFSSHDSNNPAKFYVVSYPAHTAYPTTLATQKDARQLNLGSQATANERTIFQYIHEKGIQSCQLVMGFTQLQAGSVWNTMPPHTHLRRSEVYLYFDVPSDAAVFHFMGSDSETRHLLVHGEQAVLSPPWSIHAGCGTQAYSFIWAMGGENQDFDDMDRIAVRDLK